ncbi:MAG: alpha/beta hydrolase [Gammaproteobacteria bacterium]|nr:alpha/beta hydrolase [Gammaproteobacteria bacterium]
MLLMVTSRRPKGDGYDDEEQPRYGYHYLYDYAGGQPGSDGFGKKGKAAFESVLLEELRRLKAEQDISTPKVGLYLHGYNNDWQESIDEVVDLHNALTTAMGYAPVLVGFSWPSSGKTKKYLADREEVRDSVPAFVRFLRDTHKFLVANERECFATSYCIAHSMGNYLLRKGMEYLSDHLGTPVGRAMFNETVMLAPDLASKDIEQDGKGSYIADFSRRVHVYYSKSDRALKVSSAKRFGGNRLGRHGADDYTNLPANVAIIDAKKYANSEATKGLKDRRGKQVSVHSSHRYHPKILADIVQVLSSIDRALITTRTAAPKVADRPDLPPNHFELI